MKRIAAKGAAMPVSAVIATAFLLARRAPKMAASSASGAT
jgi:hypothetical protein